MKNISTPCIYILFFYIVIPNIYGQEFLLSIKEKSADSVLIQNITYQKKHTNKESANKEIDCFLKRLDSVGFLNTKIDTVIYSDKNITTYLKLGTHIKSIQINYDGISKENIDKTIRKYAIDISNKQFTIPFDKTSYALQNIADYFETTGNSFTSVSLKNISITKARATADLQIIQSKKRNIDKIIIKGYDDFPKKFLQHKLNLKKGTLFNKQILTEISSILNHLNFVSEIKAPEVLFTNDSTYIYLYLKKKHANKFDGILGFASKEVGNGLEFNGYLDFNFNNIFNNGESIALLWKNNGNDSQIFYLGARTPYIFNLPLTPEVNFKLYRQDTTFSSTALHVKITYPLYNKGEVTAILSTENSTNLLKDTFHDPGIQSFNNVFYGGSYQFKKLENDLLFPIKFQLNINALLGNRNIENTKTSQFKFFLFTNYNYPINQKNYIFIQNQSAFLRSDNYVSNELFRIGGANSLRGVNEESIFASAYTIFNLEYRFRPTENSFFYSITDYSYFENDLQNEKSSIVSLGLGYAFVTKIGLLNISYALAKQEDAPFNINNSKIHIRIGSIF